MKTPNNISVFLVDDNATFLTTLAHYLTEHFKSEIQIETFTNGEDCQKKIVENPGTAPDIAILDYHLNSESPDAMNGIELLKKIKKIDSKITVVMLSSEDRLAIAAESIKNKAYEYVVKSESAFIRTQNILRNLIGTISAAKISKEYEKWNILMAGIILILIVIDIIIYNSR